MKQFSQNLFYKKENNLLEIYDAFRNGIISIKSQFNANRLNHFFENFNESFRNSPYLNELIFTLIMGALIESFTKLKFHNIPISEGEFKIIFQRFKNNYGEKMNISELNLDFKGDISYLKIEIINPRNTHFIQQAYLRNFSSNKQEWEANWDFIDIIPFLKASYISSRLFSFL